MAINRVAAQTMIEKIPTNLRNAARKERKALINATKNDPIGTAFQAANGKFGFFNNQKLQQKLQELNQKIATDSYQAKQTEFVHRQPTGFLGALQGGMKREEPHFVKASTYIN